MKKLLLLLIVVVFSVTQLLAQESSFQKGDKAVNLGIGFGSSYYGGFYTSHMPAMSASFEVGVADGIIDKGSIGVGGYLGYSSAKYSTYWKTSNFLIGFRGTFHYPLVNKLDTYTGLQLGYNVFTTKYLDNTYSTGGSASTLQFAWFAGARYYFTNNIGLMAEVGYGVAYLTVGIALKF